MAPEDASIARELNLALNGSSRHRGKQLDDAAVARMDGLNGAVDAQQRTCGRKRATKSYMLPVVPSAKHTKEEFDSGEPAASMQGTKPLSKRDKCQHGRQRSRCKECGGSSICEIYDARTGNRVKHNYKYG